MKEEKLVTLAIHSYEKAQILKSLLETEGIEAYLHNVNQIQPVISAGVRVRIKETDLPRALSIIEDNKWDQEDPKKRAKNTEEYVLIPVDFSEYTMKICELGFNFAARRGLRVVLMHVYISPFFSTPLTVGDTAVFQLSNEVSLRKEYQRVQRLMNKLKKELREKITREELPEISFSSVLLDGAPEDVILSYCKRHRPVMIVMGTRGKSRKDSDLIGSVAAEVIDSSKVPVLVIPEEVPFNDLNQAKHVAVATSFDQRDLVLFDAMMKLLDKNNPSYSIFNISVGTPEWNQVQLKAIREYHAHHYPDATIKVSMLNEGDFSLALEKFIRQEKVDMIVVNTYRRNFFARFFNPSMARRMLFHAGTPLLVMHN
ncbi:universal stress protein [Porphyromonas gulae]|uniref:universal stress protein n=1 Tax=Porphyromonas gulae TaxID=111105 RepID=UPI00052B72DE|nr:universal stress protein [Porphyromonas gulae]KGN89005.1 universal stress protein [Porphyromonas gulae]